VVVQDKIINIFLSPDAFQLKQEEQEE